MKLGKRLQLAIVIDRSDLLESLLEQNKNKIKPSHIDSLLRGAVLKNAPKCAELLLDRGADPTAVNGKGISAFGMANQGEGCNPIICQLILTSTPGRIFPSSALCNEKGSSLSLQTVRGLPLTV